MLLHLAVFRLHGGNLRAASAGVEQLSDDDLERLIVYALLFGNAVSAEEDDDDGEADGVAVTLDGVHSDRGDTCAGPMPLSDDGGLRWPRDELQDLLAVLPHERTRAARCLQA